MDVTERATSARSATGTVGHRTFALLFAAACVFHLASNANIAALAGGSTWLSAAQLAVGAAAVLVLATPWWRGSLVGLCLAVLASVWLEAPYIGNHWVLAGAVAGAYLTASAWATRTGESPWRTFVPVGRLVLLIAYGFAAFAKLNTDFFDPTVSCAVFYQDQMVTSWGLSALSVDGIAPLGRAVAVGAVVVELSVPLLLAVRRTRVWGVVLGMTFHWFLALDLHQHFWDFTSVLFVCFLLFLTPAQHDDLRDTAQRVWRSSAAVRGGVAAVGALGALAAIGAAVIGGPPVLVMLAWLLGTALWWALGTTTLALTIITVLRSRKAHEPRQALASPLLLLVPALVLLNGLSPYLEVKTGFGWNMYSNLRTVAGETNHLIVPRTADVLGRQHDRVTVLASTDARLAVGEDTQYVWSEFQEYARQHPDAVVTYFRSGQLFDSPSLAEDAASEGTTGVVERRVLSFRAVDTSAQERCLTHFGPAR